jgi:hypothetical protein
VVGHLPERLREIRAELAALVTPVQVVEGIEEGATDRLDLWVGGKHQWQLLASLASPLGFA